LVLAKRKQKPREYYAVSESKPEPEADKVNRAAKRRKAVGRFLVTVLVLFGLGFLLVAGQMRVAAMGYQVSELQKELEEVQAANEYLEVRAARLRTPARVEGFAREQGMRYGGELRQLELDTAGLIADARKSQEADTVVVALLDTPRPSDESVKQAGASPPESLRVLSSWFFSWLTGVRTAEAGPPQ
jgi:cell division protein FtsL